MNNNLTEIIFLLDRSGSMGGLETETIDGFNAFIENQRQLDGKTIVTAILFDDAYEIVWNGVDASEIKLTDKQYYVRGMTAFLDAVGKTIVDVGRRLSKTNEEERPGKVIVVITTDGMENASHEFTYSKVKELVKNQQEKYNWEFIFLGANMDATQEANNIGIAREDAYSFEATKDGLNEMYNEICEAVFDKRQC
ncbi:VWA domain-containing protein [Ectobacillus sp. sgz5001026]|uniref:vWA domain-containing protein n=1 Tax=Ectobacillus sp. sgz5001026 TaxID=3242473 RepID=UPI0036D2F877